jgi:hypothetical protein
VLKDALYFPQLNVNIVSGLIHYISGGCFIKNHLYLKDRSCIAALDIEKHGFFFHVKNQSTLTLHKGPCKKSHYIRPFAYASFRGHSYPISYPIEVQIPSKKPDWASDLDEIAEIDEDNDIEEIVRDDLGDLVPSLMPIALG